MLVSHHAALSALAALLLAPRVKRKRDLALFWGAAVGQDVDHYLWFAARYRNPSLVQAYRFFRARYGQPWHQEGQQADNPRPFHGPLPLALVLAATVVERRLWPIAAGMAFHGLLDGAREHLVAQPRQKRGDAGPSTVVDGGGNRPAADREAVARRQGEGAGKGSGEGVATGPEAEMEDSPKRLAVAGRPR